MRGFVRAAGNRDRISRGVLKCGSRIAQMIEKCEAGGFFDPNAPGANVLIGQRGSRDFRGALIFLPNADFDRQVELLAQRPSSNAGTTRTGWPLRGMTRPTSRSLRPHRIPVK